MQYEMDMYDLLLEKQFYIPKHSTKECVTVVIGTRGIDIFYLLIYKI